VVILTRFDFGNEIVSGLDVWNNRILESADFGLKGVPAIKKDNIIAALLN
jgi:hypothetical protein